MNSPNYIVEETDWGGAPYLGPAEPILTNKTQVSDLARAERNQAAIEELQRSAVTDHMQLHIAITFSPSLTLFAFFPAPLSPSLPPL